MRTLMIVCFVGSLIPTTAFAGETANMSRWVQAKPKVCWTTCAEWVRRCNPKGGSCNNPNASVKCSCNNRGDA